MRSLDLPSDLEASIFDVCVRGLRNEDLGSRLESISQEVRDAATRYLERGRSDTLHHFVEHAAVGTVTKDEMVDLYNKRFAKGPGRGVYDEIKSLSKNGVCPYCDHGTVRTLDHVLSKSKFPSLSVVPLNLVGCCADCNKLKPNIAPSSLSETPLHPYFDNIDDCQWLFASVSIGPVPSIIFRAEYVGHWSVELNERVQNHFEYMELGNLYSRQAAREMSNKRQMIVEIRRSGGANEVADRLREEFHSSRAVRVNSWRTALYEALSQNAWFCDVGHAFEG